MYSLQMYILVSVNKCLHLSDYLLNQDYRALLLPQKVPSRPFPVNPEPCVPDPKAITVLDSTATAQIFFRTFNNFSRTSRTSYKWNHITCKYSFGFDFFNLMS